MNQSTQSAVLVNRTRDVFQSSQQHTEAVDSAVFTEMPCLVCQAPTNWLSDYSYSYLLAHALNYNKNFDQSVYYCESSGPVQRSKCCMNGTVPGTVKWPSSCYIFEQLGYLLRNPQKKLRNSTQTLKIKVRKTLVKVHNPINSTAKHRNGTVKWPSLWKYCMTGTVNPQKGTVNF